MNFCDLLLSSIFLESEKYTCKILSRVFVTVFIRSQVSCFGY